MLKKQLLAIVIALVVVTASAYCVVFATSRICQLGNKYRQLNADRTIVAIVGPYTISRLDVEQYKIGQRLVQVFASTFWNDGYADVKLTDTEVIQALVENKVLYLESEKAGLLVPDQLLDETLADLKTHLETDASDRSVKLRGYIAGLGLTVDEYLEVSKPVFKEQLSIGQLRSITVDDLTDHDEMIDKWNEVKAEMIKLYQSEITIMP